MSNSEWELAINSAPDQVSNESEWQLNITPESAHENFGQALWNAPGRIASDIGSAAMSGLNAIPGYVGKATTEVPALLNPVSQMKRHPLHALGQSFAGINEAINSIAQLPHNISRYGSERLNLLPQSVTNAVGYMTPKDTSQAVNQLFGEPQYEGEAALRGIGRNLPSLYGAGKIASAIKPLELMSTKKSIKNAILNPHDALENRASQAFSDVSKEVNNRGINQLPTDLMNGIDFNEVRGYFPSTRKYEKLLTGAEFGDYNALRKLQSDLYTNAKKNLGSGLEVDRIRGAEMLEKRNDINEAISNHLKNTGNLDLDSLLGQARNDWSTLQKTYYNENMNNALINMFDKNYRKVPKNLVDLLGEESIPMKNLIDFHPGLEDKLAGYNRGQNALKKISKYAVPVAIGAAGGAGAYSFMKH